MLALCIEADEVAVVGESSTEISRSGPGSYASWRRLLATIDIAPATHDQKRAILADVRDERETEMSAEGLGQLSEVAGLYLPGTLDQGRAASQLRPPVRPGQPRLARARARARQHGRPALDHRRRPAAPGATCPAGRTCCAATCQAARPCCR